MRVVKNKLGKKGICKEVANIFFPFQHLLKQAQTQLHSPHLDLEHTWAVAGKCSYLDSTERGHAHVEEDPIQNRHRDVLWREKGRHMGKKRHYSPPPPQMM